MSEDAIRWLEHFVELRQRMIRSMVYLCVLFFIFLYFCNPLYHVLALPLLKNLPSGSHMIATSVASPIIIPMKFAFYLAILCGVPIFLYQGWAFIAPGLYPHEQKLIWPLVIASSILFMAGVLFAYYFIFPTIFRFFAQSLPADVAMMTDISAYLTFVMRMFFAFGMTFQIPVVILVLVKAGILTYAKLVSFRPYAIVLSFVIAMFLTPPDVVSQTLLAIPMWFLYEAGVFVTKWL